MEKNFKIEIKVKKEDREYVFSMPYGSVYGEAYDAAFDILKEILSMAQEVVKQSERKKDTVEGDSHGSQ